MVGASLASAQVPWNAKTQYIKVYRFPLTTTNDPALAANMGALVGADSLGWNLSAFGYGNTNKIAFEVGGTGTTDSLYVVLKKSSSEVARYKFPGPGQTLYSVVPQKYIWGPEFDSLFVIRAKASTMWGYITIIWTN
jgi:hypothetical protein